MYCLGLFNKPMCSNKQQSGLRVAFWSIISTEKDDGKCLSTRHLMQLDECVRKTVSITVLMSSVESTHVKNKPIFALDHVMHQ